jgi:transposase-like protein
METAKVRVRRSVAEKRRIVELTFQPGQSVARVALAEGVNSHQVFQWSMLRSDCAEDANRTLRCRVEERCAPAMRVPEGELLFHFP